MIVQAEDKPRGFWKLAKVEEVIVGQDGLVRGAVVRVGNSSTLRRPLQRLYPLEIDHSTVNDSQDCSSAVSGHRVCSEEAVTISERNEAQVNSRRPKRAAALEARDRITAYSLDDLD